MRISECGFNKNRIINWGRFPILLFKELDFSINYDIKYRMGRDAVEETEKEDS
jgi:hypothetical protein